ncbi:hypothetical protein J132_08590, partial [Termitomyces sp. J132]
SVLLINSNISSDAYTFLDVSFSDITAVCFNGDSSCLALINIYNDCQNNNSISALTLFLHSHLAAACPFEEDQMVWLGDFNRHHSL